MKKAICHYSFHRRHQAEGWDLERFADEVLALGIEGIDFLGRMMEPVGTAAARIQAVLKRTRLTMSSLSLSSNFNQPKKEDWQAQLAGLTAWMDVAAAVKAPVSRIFGGYLSQAEKADPKVRAAAWQRMLEGVAAATKEAARRGVVLVIENHGGLPCTGQEQVEVIQSVNSPFLRATIDVGNYMGGGQEGLEGTRIAAPYCAYVHLKDNKKVPDPANPWGWKVEACTVGEGVVDLPGCIEVLRQAGYAGFVGLEYEGAEDEKTGVPKSVAYMKKIVG